MNIKQKEKEIQIKVDQYKLEVDSLNKQKSQLVTNPTPNPSPLMGGELVDALEIV